MHSKIVFTDKGLSYKKDLKDHYEADQNFHEKYGVTIQGEQYDGTMNDNYNYKFSMKKSHINLNDSYRVDPLYFYKNTNVYLQKIKDSPREIKRINIDNPLKGAQKMAETHSTFKSTIPLKMQNTGLKPDVLTLTQSSNFMKPFLYQKEIPEIVERMELKRSLYLLEKIKTFEKLKYRVDELEERKNIRCDLSYGKDLESNSKEFDRLKGNYNNERKRYLERIKNYEKKKYQPIFKRLKLSRAKVYENIN